jgi:hypothetical protein
MEKVQKLNNHNSYLFSAVRPTLKQVKNVEYPCTPPPSPRVSGSPGSMYREDNLVHINMVLVDKDAPNFMSHYEGVCICHVHIFIPVMISLYI